MSTKKHKSAQAIELNQKIKAKQDLKKFINSKNSQEDWQFLKNYKINKKRKIVLNKSMLKRLSRSPFKHLKTRCYSQMLRDQVFSSARDNSN